MEGWGFGDDSVCSFVDELESMEDLSERPTNESDGKVLSLFASVSFETVGALCELGFHLQLTLGSLYLLTC